MTMVRRARLVLAGLMLGGCAVAALPGAAQADPPAPCYGDSCYGKDPHSLGCDGSTAYNLDSFDIDGAIITLWYSDWCHANWATGSTQGGGISFFVENWDGQQEPGGTNGYGWTKMVSGVPLARACVPVGETTAEYPCTGWH